MNGLDGRQQEVGQDLGAQHSTLYSTSYTMRSGPGSHEAPALPFCPYSPKCVERGILRSSP
jgi:hypothetical protein